MSIRRATYDLCKSAYIAPIRTTLQTIIQSLTTATDEQIRSGTHRAQFGSAAKSLQAQFLAFLLLDKNKARHPMLSSVDGLSEEERGILQQAHKQIKNINARCVAILTQEDPDCVNAVDPYSEYAYELAQDVEDDFLYDPALVDKLIDEFNTHPGFSIAHHFRNQYEAIVPVGKRHSAEELKQGVLALEKIIVGVGPLHTPPGLRELERIQLSNQANYCQMNYVAALTCIRASLAVLNELLYQAVLTNTLPVLDDDSIITVGRLTRNLISTGFSLKYQPSEKTGLGDLGLILVKGEIHGEKFDLCRVDIVQVEVSIEMGDTVDVTVREVDENLNPYNQLLRNPVDGPMHLRDTMKRDMSI